jgi:hypothetical protein
VYIGSCERIVEFRSEEELVVVNPSSGVVGESPHLWGVDCGL